MQEVSWSLAENAESVRVQATGLRDVSPNRIFRCRPRPKTVLDVLASANDTGLSGRPSLERQNQPTDVGPDDDLVTIQLRNRFGSVADRRQVLALHVRAGLVVVIDPLADDVIQMPSAEQNELEQALAWEIGTDSTIPRSSMTGGCRGSRGP